jgi:hypothetical protein
MAGSTNRLRLPIALALGAATATPGQACSYASPPPSKAAQARDHAEDQRLRDTSPKELLALVYVPRPNVPARYFHSFAMEWGRWTRLSPALRARFERDPNWEEAAFFAAHGSPVGGTKAYGRVSASWNRQGHPFPHLVGFGHSFTVPSSRIRPGGCSGSYWQRPQFDLGPELVRAPGQPDGTIIAQLYGYKLPLSDENWPEFVVLRYKFCSQPLTADGTCR